MSDYKIDERVDITDMVCPMTFVKAKVALEELEIGEVLDFIDNGNGTYDLIVKKLEE
jgi:TusA-related sulfurtransferase